MKWIYMCPSGKRFSVYSKNQVVHKCVYFDFFFLKELELCFHVHRIFWKKIWCLSLGREDLWHTFTWYLIDFCLIWILFFKTRNLNISTKQKQTHRYRQQICGCQQGEGVGVCISRFSKVDSTSLPCSSFVNWCSYQSRIISGDTVNWETLLSVM